SALADERLQQRNVSSELNFPLPFTPFTTRKRSTQDLPCCRDPHSLGGGRDRFLQRSSLEGNIRIADYHCVRIDRETVRGDTALGDFLHELWHVQGCARAQDQLGIRVQGTRRQVMKR